MQTTETSTLAAMAPVHIDSEGFTGLISEISLNTIQTNVDNISTGLHFPDLNYD